MIYCTAIAQAITSVCASPICARKLSIINLIYTRTNKEHILNSDFFADLSLTSLLNA